MTLKPSRPTRVLDCPCPLRADTQAAFSDGFICVRTSQIRAHVSGEAPTASVYPHPIAFNALPEIDVFLPNGYTREEWKVVSETRKILTWAGFSSARVEQLVAGEAVRARPA